MLALSPTMENGTIQKWRFKKDDQVSIGDILCDVETDKTTMEYENMTPGTILEILTHAGQSVRVGTPIAIIGKKDEAITTLLSQLNRTESGPSEPAPQTSSKQQKRESEVVSSQKSLSAENIVEQQQSGKIKASPLSLQLAAQHGIDMSTVKGSGPEGRIIKRDIEAILQSRALNFADVLKQQSPLYSQPEDIRIPLTEMRKAIAQRMSESAFSAPHYYVRTSVRVDELLQTRKAYNASHTESALSVNSFLVKMAAEAIKKHPKINTSWNHTEMIFHRSIDIGLAVALEEGLIAPIVRDCGMKTITQISSELTALIAKGRKGQLLPQEYSGATFTISNLGSFGIEEFTAIINPPGSAILAVGAVQKMPVIDEENQINIRSILQFTLSCDHRVIDGAVGARFLKELKEMIEHPYFIVI